MSAPAVALDCVIPPQKMQRAHCEVSTKPLNNQIDITIRRLFDFPLRNQGRLSRVQVYNGSVAVELESSKAMRRLAGRSSKQQETAGDINVLRVLATS